jgi:Cu/Ag efflux pump CusA
VLVIVVLFFFLAEWRTSLISCTAIPLSLLAAVAVLQFLGFGLDTMTLGGLAIAIGEVVDDAVIDVENILRRLRESAHAANPRSIFRVVLNASS